MRNEVRAASREALAKMPDVDEIATLDVAIIRQYAERIAHVARAGGRVSDWSEEEFVIFADDLTWANLATQIVAVALDNNGAGGGRLKCVTQCQDKYDRCIEGGGGYFPCAMQLQGCMLRCLLGSLLESIVQK